MRELNLRVLIAALAVASACGAATAPKTQISSAEQGRTLVRSLGDPDKRDAAYCDLLRLGLHHRRLPYRDECLPVSEVVAAPQTDGSSLYLVFGTPAYEVERAPNRHNAAGPFSLFDSDGFIIPVFQGANLVDGDSELFRYSPQGEIAVGHTFGQTHGDSFKAGHWSTQVLHVVRTTSDQKAALSVLLGPPVFGFEDSCKGFFWTWRARDLDGDGWPEVEIGPRTDEQDDMAPVATYRWSPEQRRYVGPTGSPEQGFLTYAVEHDNNGENRFVDYWRGHRDKRMGLRRTECRTVSFKGSIDGVANTQEYVCSFPGANARCGAPKGGATVEWRESDGSHAHQLLLRVNSRTPPVQIFEFSRNVDVLWSPDGRALAITDRAESTDSTVWVIALDAPDRPANVESAFRATFGAVPDIYRNGHRYFQATTWRSPSVLEFAIRAYDAAPNDEYTGQFLYRLDGTVQRR
jgi:hypothetical protein